jgi:hypothetical protein
VSVARWLIPDIENYHAPGFALLFPTAGVMLPSLYEAASQQPLPLSEMVWDPDEQGSVASGRGEAC